MNSKMPSLECIGERARDASRELAKTSGAVREKALIGIADSLEKNIVKITVANQKDIKNGRGAGLTDSVLGRLTLTPEKIRAIAKDVQTIAQIRDPLSGTFDETIVPNGLQVAKRRVPLGVIGVIYESRPNVTVDIVSICIKSGNAVILRGGKEAFNSNMALATLIKDSISQSGIPPDAVQFIESTDRDLVTKLLTMKNYIDLMIPRGGEALVRRVASEASMPAVTGGVGVCHIYVDESADLDMAVEIGNNSKLSRVYACNALDTVLVHSSVASEYLPAQFDQWASSGVECRCDERAMKILTNANKKGPVRATENDWGMEFLSFTVAIKVVDSIDEAINHIEIYGSGHTDAIVTKDELMSSKFLDEVDTGVVIVNASTTFNDGGQLGLGAEVAISTNKLHARGPMGVKELTSYKWTVLGTGQVRD